MRAPPSPASVFGLAAALSFCSLVYEMVIAACFVSFTGDAALWQSVTMGLYLASVGAGTLACGRMVKTDPWRALWLVELALTAVGAWCAGGILALEGAYHFHRHFYANSEPSATLAALALTSAHGFTLAVGFLTGFELPLLLRLARASDGKDRGRFVLAVNYGGALAGALTFSFFLLPQLGLTGSAAAASLANLCACAFLARRGAAPRGWRPAAALAGVAAAWLAALFTAPVLQRLEVLSFYARELGVPSRVREERCCSPSTPGIGDSLAELWRSREQVERVPSRYQRIEVLTTGFKPTPLSLHFNRRPAEEPDAPFGLSLFLDRRYQFHGSAEAVYHEFLAHVPIQLFKRVPRDVLILGGGDGLLAKELLKYGDRVASITNVELDPAVARLAAEDPRLRRLNDSSFSHPKVSLLIDDAFFFLRNTGRRWDAVYIDFPFPYTYDVAKLYSVELLRDVARVLAPGGFAAADYPLASAPAGEDLEDEEALRRNSIAVNTLRAAGFRTIVPYGTESPEFMPRWQADRLRPPPRDPDDDPEAARLMRRVEALRFAKAHPGVPLDLTEDLARVDNARWRESMLAFTPDASRPDFSFTDLGVRLFALDAKRLKTLEGGRFPYRADARFVNTVFRPALFKSREPVSGE